VKNAAGAIVGISTTLMNITERKLIEQALRDSEDRLRLVVDSAEDYAIFLMDMDGRIINWNRGAERMFGYTESEAIGQPAAMLFTPEDRESGVPEEEMETAKREGRASDERWHSRKNGTRFYASGVMVAVRDGHTHGYAKIARDLTAQKQAQDALQKAWEQLEARVQERTHALAGANEAMRKEARERRGVERERLQLLRRIVSTQEDERRRISRELHDQLGQRLTALRLKLEGVRKNYEEHAELSDSIAQLQTLAAQLDADVDFLAWELRPMILDDLGLTAALDNYTKEWSSHFGIPVNFHSTDHGGERFSQTVEINLYRIAQEALNNISKHAEATSADVILERRGDYAILIIEDNGRGFDPHQATTSLSGRGMGLVGMRERAALMGGTVEIESAPGAGTTIFVRTPVKFDPNSPDEEDEA
jgi:PAS domain S-box-containing protein